MNISQLWKVYEDDKRIQGFSINTLKAYALQLRMLVNELGDIHISDVYFTTECKVWLKKYLANRKDSCKALFVTETYPTRRMAIPTIRWLLKRLADRGEVETNVYPHRFLHTYTCQLLDNGAPLEFIQGMLGHEKASTTQIYAQLRGERRRELYRQFF
ncbi:tyrosine-type recombinase/integrase [Paenibacillus sp. Root444D2]|uniref:tyrosine-type recombinase/integrase n=1 Tax=Paenibacillus sp. Root444D2 TaxID=1736538 RepID=UPI000710CD65|nr:tyrosine-type recombinase/integrase [Paenibacillus sp. Root444D2]KQX68933.1 hypothetical protein ASD40_00015 [Paenibacillus sp. Root444D2]